MFRKLVPRCSQCVHFKPGGVSKTYDLGMCSKFQFEGHPYFAEMARMEPTKCGVEGVHFVSKSAKSDKLDKPVVNSLLIIKQ